MISDNLTRYIIGNYGRLMTTAAALACKTILAETKANASAELWGSHQNATG